MKETTNETSFSAQDKIIKESEITSLLHAPSSDSSLVREILAKARELKGLSVADIPPLTRISDPELLSELFSAAKFVKETIYGKRLVIFAPLYVSNLCYNECLYCAFRVKNTSLPRRALTQEEVQHETKLLIEQGHKRLLLVAGEAYPTEGLEYILKCIRTMYSTKSGPGEVRRINVNIAPLSLEDFQRLRAENIGTYQLFQETYHLETYQKVHRAGIKKNFDWRLTAIDRAMQAGIDDVGIGVLFGLYNWRFELLALMQHIQHLEDRFGVGPHTISVPRLEPASGSEIAMHPPHPVSDVEFRKLVAILRLAVPYTGIIMSTRETPEMRRETFALGVSQISAGSRTNPGGYSESEEDASQFSLGDHRSLEEVICDVISLGYIPSFCTACYRLGRTGQDFMDLAKPGEIKKHCDPNALSTLQEYLCDYASSRTRDLAEAAIDKSLSGMEPSTRNIATRLLDGVKKGKRDMYV